MGNTNGWGDTSVTDQAEPVPLSGDDGRVLGVDGIALDAAVVSEMRTLVKAGAAEMIAFRRRLHAEPELSYEEVATTDAVIERLLVQDLEPIRLDSGTGVICDIGPGEPVVALRADIDALPLEEATSLPYRSRNKGVCHACGHDLHTAAVLGAGLALTKLNDEGRLPHAVRLIFEPGEEQVPGGAIEIVEAGWLEPISTIFAVHCDPKTDVGTFGCRVGPITSASDMVEVVLCGPGGHTARPHLTVDLVQVAADLAARLPQEVAGRVPDKDSVRLVFGILQTGSAANVIPSEAVLRGSLRTPDDSIWQQLPALLEQAVEDILKPTGAQYRLRHVRGVAPVNNDPFATAVAVGAAEALVGSDHVGQAEHSWGGDSFGWFTVAVPGAYVRMGTHKPSWTQRRDLHHPGFDVDERAISHGSALLALSALSAMGVGRDG